jgi:tyrosine-specific transport protein
MISHKNRFWGAVLLISGTTLGGAMLALPIMTGLAGLVPSLCIMGLIWLLMLHSGFYFLEVNLHVRGENNLVSMAGATLGSLAQYFVGFFYLLLLYALLSSYLLGCGQLLQDLLEPWFSLSESQEIAMGSVALFFALFLAVGTEAVDILNRFMMVGFALAFGVILWIGAPKVEVEHFKYVNMAYFIPSISTVLTTFGFHVIIPSLTTYLDHDEKLLKKSLIWGTGIPFLIYIVWQLLVLGIVPVSGENSLAASALRGLQITFALKALLHNPLVGVCLRLFALFAITTSLIGVALSLEDFLADCLKWSKKGFSKVNLLALTFIPPLSFSLYYPQGFIKALDYGGILVMILLVIVPILMAVRERIRREKDPSFIKEGFEVWGGYPLIGTLLTISLALLALECIR